MEAFARLTSASPHLADVAPQLPQLGVVRVVGKAVLIGETQHFVIDACGIADAQYGHTAIHEFLADPIDGGIALGTHEHLRLAHERLVDGLDQRRCLARAGWAVQHAHVLGSQHIVDGALLARIQPRKTHGVKRECCCGLVGVEQVAQVGQAVALGLDDALQGVKHHAVARLVKEQLHANGLLRVLQFQRVALGDGGHHAVAVNIRYAAREAEVVDSGRLLEIACRRLGTEEHNRPAVLEVVVDLLVALAGHLDAVLVQGVVIGAADLEREPGVATCHLARQPDVLGHLAIGLLLLLVFHPEQFPLLLQQHYGRRMTHILVTFQPQRYNIFLASR